MRYARSALLDICSSDVSVTRTRPATLMDSIREGTMFWLVVVVVSALKWV